MLFNADILAWFARTSSLMLLAITVLPSLYTGSWIVRVADFPRFQLLVISLLAAAILMSFALLTSWKTEPWIWMAVVLVLAVWQASFVARFTPLWPTLIESTDTPDLSLVVANLDFRNESKAECLIRLRELDADVYLLVEVNELWAAALGEMRETLPHRVEVIQSEGLGLALWSRVPISKSDIKYLVSERRASVFVTFETHEGAVNFVGIHPTPPGLPVRDGDGRHDSRIRDAELLLVADHVASAPDERWIVAGDLNDVAWSRTTKLFTERSMLEDPRVGRGLINTFHAEYPLLRYPLDHVFVSAGFKVGEFERVRMPGSDHFAIHGAFQIPRTPKVSEEPASASEQRAASQMIEAGKQDAAERDRSPDS